MWCNFRASSGADEETMVNGFSTSALFKINGDSVATKIPTVMSEIQSGKLVLSIDESLFLLPNEQLMDSCDYLCFGSPIDAMCISPSGDLIICALADGNIHGVHIKGMPLFNLSIAENDIATDGQKTFVGINQVNGSYFLGCTTGRMYRLLNVDEDMMNDQLLGDDDPNNAVSPNQTVCNDTILNNVTIERVQSRPTAGPVGTFCVIPPDHHPIEGNHYVSVLAGKNCVHVQHPVGEKRVKLADDLQSFRSLYNLDHFVLGLTTGGQLCHICPHTMSVFGIADVDYLIDDIVVIENNADVIELLLLTRPNATCVRSMKIVDYPSMKCNYELTVPEFAWLIRQPKSAMNMYYLHGIHGGSEIVQEIEMRIISETQPDQRLRKLIQRGHLDDAEEFAKQFNLSLQPVYEARTRRLVIEIAAINQQNIGRLHVKFDELLKLAGQITDAEFLLSLRHIDIADRAIKRTFLEFIVANVKADLTCPQMEEINEQLRRLATLSLIDAYDCNWEWQTFVFHPDLQRLVVQTFKTDMSIACLIWKHHSAAIVPFRKIRVVADMLNAIPSAAPPFDIIMWIRHFVPVVSMVHPETLTLIVDWCVDKMRSLQFSKHWPEIGLEFITNIFEVFDGNKYLFSHIQRHHDANIAKLQSTISALKDLDSLNKNYNLTLTLDDYINDQLDDIALRILQRVSLNHLAELVREFLFPMFVKRGLNASESIVKYVKFLVKNRKSLNLWQERAVASVQQLHKEDDRIQCAWLILKAAPVPWSNALEPLVAYRTSSHPLASEISSSYDLQKINILKTKYGWPMDATDGLLKLSFRIVKLNLAEMFDDLRILTATDEQLRPMINVHCAYELTRTGRIDEATAFVQSLTAEHGLECGERVLHIMANDMDNGLKSATRSDNYVEFLTGISDKFQDDQDFFDSVLRAHRLRRDFDITLVIDQLQDQAECREFLQQGIVHIRQKLCTNPGSNLVSKCWNDVVALADTLRMDRVRVVVQLLRSMPNVHFACAMAKWVLELCTVDGVSAEYWSELAALLLVQQIQSLSDGDFPMTFPLAYHLLQRTIGLTKNPLSDTRRLLCWPRVANEAYSLQEIDYFFKDTRSLDESIVNRIIKHVKGVNVKVEPVRRESMSIFEEVIADTRDSSKTVGHAEPVVKCVALALKMFLTLNHKSKHPLFDLMLRFYDPIDGATVEDTQAAYTLSLEHLIKSKQFSAAFSIIQHTVDTQSLVQFMIIPPQFVEQFHKKMLRFTLSHKEPNFVDAQAVLMVDPRPQECLKYLSTELKSGSQKINYLTLLEQYSLATGSTQEINVSRKVRKSYFYFTELCKIDPSLKSRNDLDFSSISTLLNIMQNKILDVGFLERMSNDFDWNYQEVLVTQIITVINQQKLEFDIRLDKQGQEEIVVRTPVEAILQTCRPFINELNHTAALANELIRLMDTINFYFYELYLAVIEMLMYIDRLPREMEVWRGILLFLKHKMTTKRRNRVGQMETDAWLRSQLDVGVVPQIARFRFPFRTIVQEPLKNILDDELSVENCVHWFPLIHLHAAIPHEQDCAQMDSADYFCMSAVKNSISEYKQNSSSHGDGAVSMNGGKPQDVWNKQPTNNAFLQSILRLLKHMSDPSRKLFILYFVCSQAPEGADQVEVAYECYRFACEHQEELSQTKRAADIVVKIKRKYPILKTQHLMHLYGLADNRLFQLVESPRELINALYNHPSILRTPLANINKVAEEIAELHALNLREIQINLLEKWLADSSEGQAENMDETFYEDLNTTVEPDQRETDKTLVERIHYIMGSWSEEDAIRLLVSYIFADGASDTGKQLQAFECFMKIIDQYSDDFSDTYKDFITQEHYVVLKCVHYLKQLGYKFTVAKFMDYDKLAILKKVWSTHAKSMMAMEVIALICVGYDIYIPQIWNGVLKQMVALNMVERLGVLVHLLSTKTNLLQIDGLVLAWDCVIRSPFKSANQTKSLEQETILRKGLFALQSCPLAAKMDLLEIGRICVRLNRPHMAAVIIQLGNEDVRKHIVKIVLDANSPTLKSDIIELEGFGIYPTLVKFALTELKL